MPPTANARRTRSIPPAPAEELPEVLGEVVPAPKPRARRGTAQLRRVQEATADDKARVPRGKRAAEKADGTLTAPLEGRDFKLAEGVGAMPLMEWAAALDQVDPRNITQLSSHYRLLKAIVHPDDWDAFKVHATETRQTSQQLADFQNAAIEVMAARPTQEPAAS